MKAASSLVPTTSDGSNFMLEQTARKLGRNFNEAWSRSMELVTEANETEIERAIRTLQLIKGKTYAKALLKENGRVVNEVGFDIGIGLMLRKHNISRAELERWYDGAEKTKFEGHIFQPLPDKADAWRLFMDVRNKLFQLRSAAEELFELQKKRLLPTNTRLSREGLVTSMELGMWRLLSNEQQQETFTLLDWDELPKEARLDFFHSLPKDDKSRIYTLPDPQTREQATRAMFCKLMNKPESRKGTAPPSISPLPSKVQPDTGTRQTGKSP
jgi:hypothetical protein